MIDIKQSTIRCDKCGKLGHFQLDWSLIKLPKDWLYRTRSFATDDSPSEVQIVCSKACAGIE
jgi:hypothetical protein